MPEHALAVVGEVLVQAQAGQTSAQDAGKGRLARLDRLAPQVLAVKLWKIDSVEKHGAGFVFAAQPLAAALHYIHVKAVRR